MASDSVSVPGNAGVPAGIKPTAGEDAGVPRVADEDAGAAIDAGVASEVDAAGSAARKGWYCRGYLPHLDAPQVLQSITYRLADSLPREKLHQLDAELRHLPKQNRDATRRARIDAWLDAGMGCCVLGHPAVARCVQASFLHFHGERYLLHAWCVMPNHVHVLIEPNSRLQSIVQGWKSFTAHWIVRNRQALGLAIEDGKPIWMREYWDRYIRDQGHYLKVVDYIHQNPVKAGLCATAEAWPWSSAGNAPGGPALPDRGDCSMAPSARLSSPCS